MSTLIKPFAGIRPGSGYAGEVFCPPYDVITSEQARARAEGKPNSFLYVSKPEIGLPADTDSHSPEVYAQGARAFKSLLDAGVLVQDQAPCYYIYRLIQDRYSQTGLVAGSSIQAYRDGGVRRHEQTRPDKVKDRADHIKALGAQTGPVLAVYRDLPAVTTLLGELADRSEPQVDEVDLEGVRHQLWVVDQLADIDRIDRAFLGVDRLYIADGHHRSAAAEMVAKEDTRWDVFLTVLFPEEQLRILGYHRLVRDFHGLALVDFKAALVKAGFELISVSQPYKPNQARHFGMYCGGQWYHLHLDVEDQSVLDCSVLSDNVLAPILAITDLRVDPRIGFVGGVNSVSVMEQAVDSGVAAVGFLLAPTPMAALLRVADAGEVMPPKSTWFEPKLADGLVSLALVGDETGCD